MPVLSDLSSNAAIDAVFGNVAPSVTSHRIGLSSTDPGDDGTGITEPAVGGYAPVVVDNDKTTWEAADARGCANAIDFVWPEATADYAADVAWYYIADDDTDDFITGGALPGGPYTITTGMTPRLPAGSLSAWAPDS